MGAFVPVILTWRQSDVPLDMRDFRQNIRRIYDDRESTIAQPWRKQISLSDSITLKSDAL